jgi:hypothetical protein
MVCLRIVVGLSGTLCVVFGRILSDGTPSQMVFIYLFIPVRSLNWLDVACQGWGAIGLTIRAEAFSPNLRSLEPSGGDNSPMEVESSVACGGPSLSRYRLYGPASAWRVAVGRSPTGLVLRPFGQPPPP